MPMNPTIYPVELRESSIRMVFDTRSPGESLKAACLRVGPLVNVNSTTLTTGASKQPQQTLFHHANLKLLASWKPKTGHSKKNSGKPNALTKF